MVSYTLGHKPRFTFLGDSVSVTSENLPFRTGDLRWLVLADILSQILAEPGFLPFLHVGNVTCCCLQRKICAERKDN